MKALSAFVVCALLSATGAAKAATITETYDFTANGGPASPVNPWDGSFTITFNPTAIGDFGPLALDAFSSNLPASYGTFMYIQGDNLIIIGDNCIPGECIADPNQAFFSFTVDASGNPTPPSFVAVNGDIIGSDLSVTLAPAATPLPPTLPLFATALGGLGLLGWRRKRKAQVVAG